MVLFRCDASSTVGFGHLMRCMALAECLRAEGDTVRFLLRDDAGARRLMRKIHVPVTWLPASCAGATLTEAIGREVKRLADAGRGQSWVVVDSYEQAERQRAPAYEAGARVLVMDDLGGSCGHADLVVNPNLEAEVSWYPGMNGTTLLLGSAYVLLRREFLNLRPTRDVTAPVRRILVTLGGSDRRNRTALVLEGLKLLPAETRGQLEVHVVLGPGCRHGEAIEGLAKTLTYRCAIHSGVSRMAELMQGADLAITAGGGTVAEAAFLGVPSVTLILSENQQRNAEAFARRGVTRSLGDAAALEPSAIASAVSTLIGDPRQRAAMSAQGRATIDGKGAARIREAMLARNRFTAAGSAAQG